MSAPCFFAGIDGGGSKTVVVLVDHTGSERARVRGGSSNQSAIGPDAALATLNDTVQRAAAEAGAALPLARAWFGLAGFDRAGERARMEPVLRRLASSLAMTNDARLALSSLPASTGIALICGTGSISYGVDPAGRTNRAGGWGNLIGDEGSGWAMGRAALVAVAQATDGYGPPTELTERILSHWRITDPYELISRIYDPATTKGDIAELSGVVFAAMDHGDAVARSIVDQAVKELSALPVAVASRLDFPGPIPFAVTGGLLLNRAPFCQRIFDRIAAHLPVERPVLVDDPALAAARAAITGGGPFE